MPNDDARTLYLLVYQLVMNLRQWRERERKRERERERENNVTTSTRIIACTVTTCTHIPDMCS